ncbi:MAG: hypothetical protein V1817_04670 [Candidatus Micrarchaeota archaeon]
MPKKNSEKRGSKRNTLNKLNKRKQKALALWAADCAERVLPFFEKEYPKDDRPRNAIQAARAWTRGEITVGSARASAIAAHAAARDAARARHPAACAAAVAAARAAGHAAATAHVVGHAVHAAVYAVKAAEAAGAASVSGALNTTPTPVASFFYRGTQDGARAKGK